MEGVPWEIAVMSVRDQLGGFLSRFGGRCVAVNRTGAGPY